jgi:hypothetical protein
MVTVGLHGYSLSLKEIHIIIKYTTEKEKKNISRRYNEIYNRKENIPNNKIILTCQCSAKCSMIQAMTGASPGSLKVSRNNRRASSSLISSKLKDLQQQANN